MGRLVWLELRKLRTPVLFVMTALTLVTCILCCTLFRNYSLLYILDKWEIGTEYLALVFPLAVTVPVCWQICFERRDRFLVYTLPRIRPARYLTAKWMACALSAFGILFVPCLLSALCALYAAPYQELHPEWTVPYRHVAQTLYTMYPLVYALLLSLWKSAIGVLVMSFGFVLALYSSNLFVVLTGPFVYMIVDNFFWGSLRQAVALVVAFEPGGVNPDGIGVRSLLWGPVQLCLAGALAVVWFRKVRRQTVYPL